MENLLLLERSKRSYQKGKQELKQHRERLLASVKSCYVDHKEKRVASLRSVEEAAMLKLQNQQLANVADVERVSEFRRGVVKLRSICVMVHWFGYANYYYRYCFSSCRIQPPHWPMRASQTSLPILYLVLSYGARRPVYILIKGRSLDLRHDSQFPPPCGWNRRPFCRKQ